MDHILDFVNSQISHIRQYIPIKLTIVGRAIVATLWYFATTFERYVANNLEKVESVRIRREKLSIQLEIHQKKREAIKQMAENWKQKIYKIPSNITKIAINYYSSKYEDFDEKLTYNGGVAYY